jgi:hypothetical protein
MNLKTMTKEQIERKLRLIETEINLWRKPWQSIETPLEEKSLILHRVMDLLDEEKELRKQLNDQS